MVAMIGRQLEGASTADEWCKGWVAGISGVLSCARDVPAPTDADLDAAALARPVVRALAEALELFDGLIDHQYSGSREAMSAMTYAAQVGVSALAAAKEKSRE